MNKQVKKCIEKYALPFIGNSIPSDGYGEYVFSDKDVECSRGTILIKKNCTELEKVIILLHELKHRRDDIKAGIDNHRCSFIEKRAHKFVLRFLKRYDKFLFDEAVEYLKNKADGEWPFAAPHIEYAFKVCKC